MKTSLGFGGACIKHLASFLVQCLHMLSGIMVFLFMPSQLHLDELEQWNELDNEELDEISLQLDQLWLGFGRQLSSRKLYPCRSENTGLTTSLQVVTELRSLRLSLLSYVSINAASSQMLACYRYAGEPAAMGDRVDSTSPHFVFSSNITDPCKLNKHSLRYCSCAFFLSCRTHSPKSINKICISLFISLASLPVNEWVLFNYKSMHPPDFELSLNVISNV